MLGCCAESLAASSSGCKCESDSASEADSSEAGGSDEGETTDMDDLEEVPEEYAQTGFLNVSAMNDESS